MNNKMTYEGRKVSKRWFTTRILKKKKTPQRRQKRRSPILARILLPAAAGFRDDRVEMHMLDLSIQLHRWDAEVWRDAYLTPPCTELPTFFPDIPNCNTNGDCLASK